MECSSAQLGELQHRLQVVLRVGGMARVPGKGPGPGTDPLPDQGLGALGNRMGGGHLPQDSARARNRSWAKHQHQDGHRLGGGTAQGGFVRGPSPGAPARAVLCHCTTKEPESGTVLWEAGAEPVRGAGLTGGVWGVRGVPWGLWDHWRHHCEGALIPAVPVWGSASGTPRAGCEWSDWGVSLPVC